MKSSKRALLVLVCAAALLVPATDALAASYCERSYYSDATYTVLVGERITTCQGQVYSWGVVTPYRISACEPCGGGALTDAAPDAGTTGPLATAAVLEPAAVAPPARP